jgi:hypothetical protein
MPIIFLLRRVHPADYQGRGDRDTRRRASEEAGEKTSVLQTGYMQT